MKGNKKMEEITHKRLDFIDIAKGIGMIAIILGHLKNFQLNRVVYTFHVPLFFLISGYFIKAEKNTNSYIKNKVRTLIIPYICTCAIIILITLFQGLIGGNGLKLAANMICASIYGAGDTYKEPFFIPSIGALWFLLATFWGCIFLKLSLNFNEYNRLLFIAGLFFIGEYTAKLFWIPFSIQAGACATLYMYIGYLVKQNQNVIKSISKEMRIVFILIALAIWIEFMVNYNYFELVHCYFGRGVTDFFGSLCACLIIICIAKLIDQKTKISRKFLTYLGRFSLIILCVHATELVVLPEERITNCMYDIGMKGDMILLGMIVLKLTLNLSLAFLLSKIKIVRKVLGYKENILERK